jgi:dolichyl-phosphate-mannose-protein mannosyltransferase
LTLLWPAARAVDSGPMTGPSALVSKWLGGRPWVLAGVVLAGLGIRIVALPSPGYIGDIDLFVAWVGQIARNGLPNAYDAHLSFGPVMVYVWGLLGVIDPMLVTAVNSSDVAARIVMKLPAVVADFVLAGTIWFALRAHPRWATAAVAVVLLHPAVWLVSAWWGQYDSIYVAAAAVAFVFAINGRYGLAVVSITVAMMTKPQAAPLVVPFAAWFVARAGWRAGSALAIAPVALRLTRLAGVGLATLVVLWLPFLAAGGPLNYLRGVATYQGESYAVLSMSAWNFWWLVQGVTGHGALVLDAAPLIGGLSGRIAGYVLTAVLLAAVAWGLTRRPTPRSLALALAAASLVSFAFLTTMHERYAFAVLPMLLFVVDDRRIRWLTTAFGLMFFVNLLASLVAPPSPVSLHGWLGAAISVANIVCALFLVLELVRDPRRPEPAALINEVGRDHAEQMPPSTSGRNGEATSAA